MEKMEIDGSMENGGGINWLSRLRWSSMEAMEKIRVLNLALSNIPIYPRNHR